MTVTGGLRRIIRRVAPWPAQRPTPWHIFLSYPKCGRTWVRFMVNAYLAQRYGRRVTHVFEIERDAWIRKRHPILFTHFTGAMVLDRPYYDMGHFETRRTLVPHSHGVLLTRNLYATLASAYFQARYRIGRVADSPSSFLRDPRYGAIKLVAFYNLWTELRSEFLSAKVLSYEALTADTTSTFIQVLESLGLGPVDPQLAARVASESSFERLQELALSEAYRGTGLAPVDRANRNAWQVRDGRPQGFRDIFSQEDLRYIARLADDLLLDQTLVDRSC